MSMSEEKLNRFASTISIERLLSFRQSENDTVDVLIERYKANLLISQAFYPELSTLEITLRNAIDTMLKSCISETWLEDELIQRKILTKHEHEKLIKAYSDTRKEYLHKDFTRGKVIANLNFGFWTNLCSKRYNAVIWTKKGAFKGVFVNYPTNLKQQIHALSLRLRVVRYLRNRIFHYEPIFKHPQNTLNMYNEIMELISYLPVDDANILKETSTFLNVYNQALAIN